MTGGDHDEIINYYAKTATQYKMAFQGKELIEHASSNTTESIKTDKDFLISYFQYQESPYHTIHPGDSLAENWNALTSTKQCRSNSWSESLDDFRAPQLFNGIV